MRLEIAFQIMAVNEALGIHNSGTTEYVFIHTGMLQNPVQVQAKNNQQSTKMLRTVSVPLTLQRWGRLYSLSIHVRFGTTGNGPKTQEGFRLENANIRNVNVELKD